MPQSFPGVILEGVHLHTSLHELYLQLLEQAAHPPLSTPLHYLRLSVNCCLYLTTAIHQLRKTLGSLSMQRFWATDGNRKWTFRTLEQWSLSDFENNLKIFENNINVVVWREVKYENSTLPVAVGGSKTLHA